VPQISYLEDRLIYYCVVIHFFLLDGECGSVSFFMVLWKGMLMLGHEWVVYKAQKRSFLNKL